MTQEKSILEKNKDVIKYIYGTILACSLYFGVTTKIEILSQKHDDDIKMIDFRIARLEAQKETSNRTNEIKKPETQYAILPKHILMFDGSEENKQN